MPESRCEIIDELIEECSRQVETPPRAQGVPDKYVGMFAVALSTNLQASSEGANTFAYAISKNLEIKPFPPSVAFHSLLRFFQMEHMRDPSYPFNDQEQWNAEIQAIFEDEAHREHIAQSMQMWDVGSDVETRAAGPKLIAHTMLAERATDEFDPLKILSVGSARDHGLAMIAGDVPFPELKMAPIGRFSETRKWLVEARVNEILGRHTELGHSTGVDLWPLRDPGWSSFLEACRYYPSELRDVDKRKRYLTLEDVRDTTPQLDHIDIDFSDEVDLKDTYDIVLFSTSLYQNLGHEQESMFTNAIKHTAEGGKIVIQDFCKYRPAREDDIHPLSQVEFLGPVSKPYTYKTMVFDPQLPEKGLQRFMDWNNGRCEVFKPARLLLKYLLGQDTA